MNHGLHAIVIPIMKDVSSRVSKAQVNLLYEVFMLFTLSYPKFMNMNNNRVPYVVVFIQNISRDRELNLDSDKESDDSDNDI